MAQETLEMHNLRVEFNVTLKAKNEFVRLATKQRGEIRSLTVELNSMKAQRDRWRKEANNLKKKLETSEKSKDEICEYSKDKLVEIENLNGEIRVLTQDLQGTTAVKDRFKRRMELYKGRLDTIEESTGDATDEANVEEYEEAEDGRYRAENNFNQRNHYREM